MINSDNSIQININFTFTVYEYIIVYGYILLSNSVYMYIYIYIILYIYIYIYIYISFYIIYKTANYTAFDAFVWFEYTFSKIKNTSTVLEVSIPN